jgi:hypothetical protein
MKLPDSCPHTLTPWQRMILDPIATIPCCRADGRALMLADEEPLCGTARREAEAYRFIWRSGFDGDASVRIGRQGDAITLRWRYEWFRAPTADDAPTESALSLADWARFREVLIAANFWAIDPTDGRPGLDGAEWLIEGRRGNVYRGVSRWSPQGKLHDVGRLFFALAGPPLSKAKLY